MAASAPTAKEGDMHSVSIPGWELRVNEETCEAMLIAENTRNRKVFPAELLAAFVKRQRSIEADLAEDQPGQPSTAFCESCKLTHALCATRGCRPLDAPIDSGRQLAAYLKPYIKRTEAELEPLAESLATCPDSLKVERAMDVGKLTGELSLARTLMTMTKEIP